MLWNTIFVLLGFFAHVVFSTGIRMLYIKSYPLVLISSALVKASGVFATGNNANGTTQVWLYYETKMGRNSEKSRQATVKNRRQYDRRNDSKHVYVDWKQRREHDQRLANGGAFNAHKAPAHEPKKRLLRARFMNRTARVQNQRLLQTSDYLEEQNLYHGNGLQFVHGSTITGFYHLTLVGNWREVLSEQLKALERSGLLGASEKLIVGVTSPLFNPDEDGMEDLDKEYKWDELLVMHHMEQEVLGIIHSLNLSNEAKVELGVVNARPRQFEHITLNLAREHCQAAKSNGQKEFIYYLHSKGVTHTSQRTAEFIIDWRRFMQAFLFEQPALCVTALEAGYLTCGVNLHSKLIPSDPAIRPHYSGNFWWAHCDHIARLPPVLGTEECQQALAPGAGGKMCGEMWVAAYGLMDQLKCAMNLWTSRTKRMGVWFFHYKNLYPREMYEEGLNALVEGLPKNISMHNAPYKQGCSTDKIYWSMAEKD